MRDEPRESRRHWRIPDELWERLQPLLPPRKPHPLGFTGRASMIAGPWMPSSSSSVPAQMERAEGYRPLFQ